MSEKCPKCGAGKWTVPDGSAFECGTRYEWTEIQHSRLCHERAAHNGTKAALATKWRKEADQYQRQVEEARRAGTPFDQMLATMTVYRQCANEIERMGEAK